MERSALRSLSHCVHLLPEALVHIKLEQIIETLLVCVDTSKDDDFVLVGDGRVTVPGLWPGAFDPSDLEPQVGQERVLVDVVHGVVAVPSTYHEHEVFADYG